MSSSTTLTFIFPELTTLEVTIGNGIAPRYLGIAENDGTTFNGIEALRLMGDSNVVGVMTRFDHAILGLLLDRHATHENAVCQSCIDGGREYSPSEGLHLTVAHF